MTQKRNLTLSSALLRREVRVSLPLNQRGQSLIQVLISIGLMGILMAAFATMMGNQQRETSRLQQKLASLDLLRVLTTTLADGGVCTYILTTPTAPTFNPMAIGSPSIFPPIQKIPSKGVAGATAVAVADDQTPPSPLDRNLVVKSIKVTNLACAVQPCTPNTNQFTANIQITFDSAKLVMAFEPLSFPITILTQGPPGAQTVESCVGGGGIQQASATGPWTRSAPQLYHANATAVCPSGYAATGGGAFCDTSAGCAAVVYSMPSGSNSYYGSCANWSCAGSSASGASASGFGVKTYVYCKPL